MTCVGGSGLSAEMKPRWHLIEAPGYGDVLFPLLKLKTDGCLHRSQDRHGIYIVIFEYRDDYILLEDSSAPEAYMIMHEFGPVGYE